MNVEISLAVNGREWAGEVEPRLTLADLLRDHLALTGTHLGCEHGVCGACTVLLDGQAARSCLTLAVQADGRQVTTVEGLSEDLLPRELFQCGFCRSGFVCSAEALLRREPLPRAVELPELLAGNICRCTGYEPILDALSARLPG
ncbi:MAG: (2Fe-2S)-binding protein [Candidatus Dormibacteraeota bacterium]|uniref:(2Fe-2S)-binding protein n=1 Tax=Candidatus Dormiibacter inghamiae TaxID=3127013 RepID=A0A934NEV4_9BACT|nr:(2Fe-2S)-binding protein [Candidatus Dormibacteraeota bacterium]MBJ7605135.1 (2Fe-2S)-binding protein [Candidatus Dormibacteraeota bacterium]